MTRKLTLAIAVSVAIAGAATPTRAQGAGVAQLLRDACVDTGLDREAFERLARERRWRAVRLTQSPRGQGWNVAYRVDGALVMLRGGAVPGHASADTASCSVSVERAPAALEGQIDSLATSLGLASEGMTEDVPGFVPIRIWSRFGEATLTFASAPDGRAVVSFSRQHVTSVVTETFGD